MKIRLLIVLLFSCCFAFSAEKVVLIEGKEKGFESVAEFASVYVDKSNTLTIDDVINGQIEFTPIETPNPNFDFTTSSFWIKFSLKNNSHHKEFFIETARPLTNVADLYYTDSEGEFQLLQNGDDRPFDTRQIKHRKVVFPVELGHSFTTEFYLHLKSDGEVLTAPIKVWTPEAFENQDYKEQFIMGSYYGLLLFVIIIYFFFYVALKEKSFLYYVIYVISLFFFQFAIDGYAFQYLFPNSSWVANHMILFSAGITVAFVVKYTQEFLRLKEWSNKLNNTFNIFIGATAGITILSLIDGPTYQFCFPLINGISLISTLTILGIILWGIKQQRKISKLFLIAFLFLIVGAIIFILGNFNVIEPSFLTEQSVKLGSAFEVIFLSLTMAKKFSEIQQEKEKAQADLLEQMDQANEKLEFQVKERTAEIHQQKETLAEQHNEIIDSINYAKGIQDSILPTTEKIKKHLPKSFVLFRPKDIVSGDFYWMDYKNGVSYFTAADCTGHGVPGGFVSMVGANGLNRCVNEYDLAKPSDILDRLTLLVQESFKGRKDGMDMSICAYHESTKTLEWCGAQNPMFIVSNKKPNIVSSGTEFKTLELDDTEYKLHDFKPNKQPVANYDYGEAFTNHEIKIQEGDRVYLLTDGFSDQFGGPKGKKFMSKNLKKLLLENHTLSMVEIHELLNSTIEHWMKEANAEQIDDICIFGVEF
ncbi:MAG: SpoIIE family protein phosphatase [Flavobacteriales bacterium]|nr:SpoIIE family protein phosphatase [Flavobacteriales bacterium]